MFHNREFLKEFQKYILSVLKNIGWILFINPDH